MSTVGACLDCGAAGVHVEQWDSFACLGCNKWLESECNCSVIGVSCEFSFRPEAPLPTCDAAGCTRLATHVVSEEVCEAEPFSCDECDPPVDESTYVQS